MSEHRSTDTVGSPPSQEDAEDAAVGCRALTRKFGGFVAVDRVDIAVPAGELRAIIGPNGAGKTTLFNLLTNALEPTNGSIYFRGQDVTAVPQYERPHLGMVRSFQSNQLFTRQTVLENVRIVAQTADQGSTALDFFRRGRGVALDRAHEVLDLMDLDHVAEEVAENLSHGDQRRLGIAMTLATDSEVLLLDEPTSGMGSEETQETAELIETMQEDLGLTLLLIEHDMDIVLSMSDRITVLHGGSVLATGTADEIQADDSVQEAYLGGMQDEI